MLRIRNQSVQIVHLEDFWPSKQVGSHVFISGRTAYVSPSTSPLTPFSHNHPLCGSAIIPCQTLDYAITQRLHTPISFLNRTLIRRVWLMDEMPTENSVKLTSSGDLSIPTTLSGSGQDTVLSMHCTPAVHLNGTLESGKLVFTTITLQMMTIQKSGQYLENANSDAYILVEDGDIQFSFLHVTAEQTATVTNSAFQIRHGTIQLDRSEFSKIEIRGVPLIHYLGTHVSAITETDFSNIRTDSEIIHDTQPAFDNTTTSTSINISSFKNISVTVWPPQPIIYFDAHKVDMFQTTVFNVTSEKHPIARNDPSTPPSGHPICNWVTATLKCTNSATTISSCAFKHCHFGAISVVNGNLRLRGCSFEHNNDPSFPIFSSSQNNIHCTDASLDVDTDIISDLYQAHWIDSDECEIHGDTPVYYTPLYIPTLTQITIGSKNNQNALDVIPIIFSGRNLFPCGIVAEIFQQQIGLGESLPQLLLIDTFVNESTAIINLYSQLVSAKGEWMIRLRFGEDFLNHTAAFKVCGNPITPRQMSRLTIFSIVFGASFTILAVIGSLIGNILLHRKRQRHKPVAFHPNDTLPSPPPAPSPSIKAMTEGAEETVALLARHRVEEVYGTLQDVSPIIREHNEVGRNE
ncbi:hypothetical protein BLNAU_20 [Blattamonas nauphoetae]|uniref:Transmembrane protein n=1 Tax=Blattamonas nauphoetae TaxID=2049346 RepID=A0ABQ9YLT3_9EUKA|nr:hypothetical protein BLNAU_20 [Blattamonas nauphoetae]